MQEAGWRRRDTIGMKIFIKAKPSAKEERVEKTGAMHFTVYVKEPPVRGLANRAILRALSEHLNISISEIRISSGHTSRNKIIEITKK